MTHALDNIRKGFEYTSIEPPVKIGNSLTIEECNILHRVFTTKIKDKRYDRLDLQLINHGVHEYEQSFSEEILNETNFSSEAATKDAENDTSNGLENFVVDEESSPDLFSSDDDNAEDKDLLSTEISEDSSESDDLEIPAFLRRQKN